MQYRLSRLERTLNSLVDRLDARIDDIAGAGNNIQTRATSSTADTNTAPVFLIRDAATDAGVQSPEANHTSSHSDVISQGLVTLPVANSLLEL